MEEAGEEDVDVVVEEADQEKRAMKLCVSEHSRRSTNLVTEREDTTRRWRRQVLAHRRKVWNGFFDGGMGEIETHERAFRT